MNTIKPKNKDLYKIAKDLLLRENVCLWDDKQYEIDNFIINAHFTISECLQLDNFHNIIDGFVITDFRNHLYKSKSIFELLSENNG